VVVVVVAVTVVVVVTVTVTMSGDDRVDDGCGGGGVDSSDGGSYGAWKY
jgi:hypothetical protein